MIKWIELMRRKQFKTYDGSDGADDLDWVSSLSRIETGLLEQKLGDGQSDVAELSVDPTTALGSVVGTDKDLAGLVHQVLATQILAVQENRIVC